MNNIEQLVAIIQIVVLFFTLMSTFVMLRTFLQVHAYIVNEVPFEMGANIIRYPAIWWCLFWATFLFKDVIINLV